MVQCDSVEGALSVEILERLLQRYACPAVLSLVFAVGAGQCQESQPALRGLAEFESVQAEVASVKPYLISVCRGRSLQCVLVHIKNDSNKMVSVDGDHARAGVAGSVLEPQSKQQITKASCCTMSVPATLALAAVGTASLGFTGPILFEMLTNKRQHHFYNGGFGFGDDGVRHEIEGARFGKRLLLQGDEMSGWFCFQTANLTGLTSLQIPVSSGSKSGIVEVKVQLPSGTQAEQAPDRRL